MNENKPTLVLVVDDEEGIVEIFKAFLQELSFQVFGATSGKEALEIFNLHAINCIITDVSMPTMNGIELAAQVRKINKDIPLFFMTAYHDQPREVLNQFFPKAIIFKPFDFEETSLLIKKMI